jgi:hypothetical protein
MSNHIKAFFNRGAGKQAFFKTKTLATKFALHAEAVLPAEITQHAAKPHKN